VKTVPPRATVERQPEKWFQAFLFQPEACHPDYPPEFAISSCQPVATRNKVSGVILQNAETLREMPGSLPEALHCQETS